MHAIGATGQMEPSKSLREAVAAMAGPGAELRYEEAPRQAMQRPMPKDCWAVNACARPAGHWGDSEWYDLQLERRLPLVGPMLNEVVCALPPLGNGRVCDVGCGTGRCAVEIRKAYPRCTLCLLDADKDRVETAKNRVAEPVEVIVEPFVVGAPSLPGAPYDCVTLVLALRHSTRPAPHYAERLGLKHAEGTVEESYRAALTTVFCSLRPGGTLLIGDQVAAGHPSVYDQCKLLEDCGFEHVDIAWRDRDFFVIGAAAPADDPEPSWFRGEGGSRLPA